MLLGPEPQPPTLHTHTHTHTHTRRPSDTHDPSRSMRRDSPALLFYFFSFFYLSLPTTFLGRLLAMRAQTHKTVERVASLWFR